MVFPIDYNKDNSNDDHRAENTLESNNEKHDELLKPQKGKQSLTPLLPNPKKPNQFPNKNKEEKFGKKPAKRIIPVQTPAQAPTIVGPYGSQVGFLWDDGTHYTVRQIVVVAGNCVESIHIEYVDDDGESVWSQKHGGLDKFYEDKIILDYPEEFLISISGYYDTNSIHVMSLTFHTNVRHYGPFGVESGVYFTFPSTGGKIIGFHGRSSECLNSIGAYYEPCLTRGDDNDQKSRDLIKTGDEVGVGGSAEARISMGPFGGQGGTPWDDGIFTTIRQLVIVSDSGIKSIHIEYDKNGSSEWSEKRGESGQQGINKVKLDYPNEFLISISGFYSSESIEGLTLQSNKKTYGPFGKVEGTHFSTPSTGGKIIGFYGHSDANLVSIGAYFEPIFCPHRASQKPISVGPFGGRGGVPFDDGTFTGVRQFTIASGQWFDSICIEYDSDGCSVSSKVHGGSGGSKCTITLDYPDEFLISAWGYIYEAGTFVFVRSLTFQSNRKTYGPFGIEQGKKFSFPSTGGKIIGFHGKSDRYLDAIGVYLEPTTSLSSSKSQLFLENASKKAFNRTKEPAKRIIPVPTPTQMPTIVGPYGSQFGFLWDDGTHNSVRQIVIVTGNRVESIHIEYDDDGESVWCQKHGGLGKFYENKIRLDYPEEFLISVSGYYDTNSIHVMSLTFHSNVRIYGPFGVESGVYFTFPSTGGKIIGFLGRRSDCLCSIGAYYEPCLTREDNNQLKSLNLIKTGDEVGVGRSEDAPISMGPFGGQGGSPWDDGFFTTVRQIVIVLDSGIKSIHIEYDNNGSSEWSEEHGESGPNGVNKVKLEYPNEFLISISGFYSSESIQALTIQSNRKTYGPFGKVEGTHFSTPSTGGKIIGFYGHSDTNLVSIGAYFEPIFYPRPTSLTPMSVGPFGGRGGVSFDDGTFTGIRQLTIASGQVVDSICVEYDNNGCSVNSRVRGGSGGENKSTITLDYPDEFLISAWGYLYKDGTFVIVRSLTIQSNRKTYGPFGVEHGKKFSFPSTGGKIIGFHGKSGQYLDAIGAYLEPTTHSLSSSKTKLLLENALSSSNEVDEPLSTASTSHDELNEPLSTASTSFDELEPLSTDSTSHDELDEPLSILIMYGPWGGTAGKKFNDGVFTGVRAIQLTRNGALTSIQVLYDRGGQPVWGSKIGGSFGFIRLSSSQKTSIEFDYPSEVLTHISGFYQSIIFKGETAVSSITFHTTKQTYGPFGIEEGTSFSSSEGIGSIVGFHGRKGKFVYGIGIHLLKEK